MEAERRGRIGLFRACLEGQTLVSVLSLFNLFILSAVQDFCVTETGPDEAG